MASSRPAHDPSSLVCIVDGDGTLILTDEDNHHHQTSSAMRDHDILQQALAEVTSSSSQLDSNKVDFGLDPNETVTLYVEQAGHQHHQQTHQHQPVGAKVKEVNNESVGGDNVITLFQANDGSLHYLTPEQLKTISNANEKDNHSVSKPAIPSVALPSPPPLGMAQPLAGISMNKQSHSAKQMPLIMRSNVTKTLPKILPKPAAPAPPAPAPPPTPPTAEETVLVKRGSTFYTKQSMSNTQLSQVAKILRREQTVNKRTQEETKIVVDQEKGGSPLIYTVIFPDDLDDEAIMSSVADNEEELSSSDSDEIEVATTGTPSSSLSKVQEFFPHELVSKALLKKIIKTKRKRGRPTREEKMAMSMLSEKPEIHAKRLKKEFGLSSSQLQSVGKDIVSDKEVIIAEEGTFKHPHEDNEDTKKHTSRTRSGRVSKPPPAVDEIHTLQPDSTSPSLKPSSNANGLTECSSSSSAPVNPPVPKFEDRPKRKFQVPDKYRCRVCHKMYLGDRKMNRHMRLFPSHGPPLQTQLSSVPATNPVPTMTNTTAPKMTDFTMPIIPMARNQLEELVRNLDSELVLDVVAKKMFSNFSSWDLELKRLSLLPEKGLKRLEKLFDHLEQVLQEGRKIADHCLTSTKPRRGQDVGLNLGENCQAALNLHEGPWYFQDTNLISEEYHRILDIQTNTKAGIPMSPTSDSGHTVLMGGDEENSNSMMSMSSDRDHSLGAQMVLERNLAAVQVDEDTQDGSLDNNSQKKFHRSKNDSHSHSPHYQEEGDSSNISSASNLQNPLDRSDVDPSKVLEQNGINISVSSSDEPRNERLPSLHNTTGDLEQDIDSLGPLPLSPSSAMATETSAERSYQRTRLPSFSSIIGGSPKEPTLANESQFDLQSSDDHRSKKLSGPHDLECGLVSVLSPSVERPRYSRSHSQHDETLAKTVMTSSSSSSIMSSVSNVLHDELKRQLSSAMEGGTHQHQNHPDLIPIHGLSDFHSHQQQHHSSGPPSVSHHSSHVSCPPSVDHRSHVSGPPSIDHQMLDIHHSQPNSPQVNFHHHHNPHSVPASSVQASGPPSVDVQQIMVSSNPSSQETKHVSLPNSPISTTECTSTRPSTAVEQVQKIPPNELFEPGDDDEEEEEEDVEIITTGESSAIKEKDKSLVDVTTTHDSNSNLFNDLDCVLNEAGSFPFQSALNSDSLQQMKTPEKLLHSIPPTSILIDKVHLQVSSASSDISGPPGRTNFLGALEQNNGGRNRNCMASSTSSSTLPTNLFTQSDTLLLSDIHGQGGNSGDHHSHCNEGSKDDSLSKLFNEIAEQNHEKC